MLPLRPKIISLRVLGALVGLLLGLFALVEVLALQAERRSPDAKSSTASIHQPTYNYDSFGAHTTTSTKVLAVAFRTYDRPAQPAQLSAGSIGPRLAAEGGAAIVRGARTSFGRLIQDFRRGGGWERVSAHAEPATGRAYRGGTSIEEVFERGGDRIVRHRIYDPNGEIVHQTYRPDAKFGAP